MNKHTKKKFAFDHQNTNSKKMLLVFKSAHYVKKPLLYNFSDKFITAQ
jgi:hypothetical protein